MDKFIVATVAIAAMIFVLVVTTNEGRDKTRVYENYLYECKRTADEKLFIFERKDADLTIAILGASYFTITDDDGYLLEIPVNPTAAFSCRKKHIGTYTK